MADSEPLQWTDGDQPFNRRFGDHFYARENGRAETSHVFIGENRLVERWSEYSGRFAVAELGFGTGLNFCETWRQWQSARRQGQHLSFVSFEAFPMRPDEMARALSCWPDLAAQTEAIHRRWPPVAGTPVIWNMDDQTDLTVFMGEAIDGVLEWDGMADAWYLDGFAPSRNPAMWSPELMQAVFNQTVPGGTFAT